MTLFIPNDINNGQPADGLELETNFNAIQQYINTELMNRDGSVQMTGPLVLVADPTQAMQAATKGYVDAATVAKKYTDDTAVRLDGDTMTGTLVVKDAAVSIRAPSTKYAILEFYEFSGTPEVYKRYGWMGKQPSPNNERIVLALENNAYFLVTGGDIRIGAAQGTQPSSLTRKDYVDTKLAEAGGTVTGDLTVNGSIFAKKQIAITDAPTAASHAATKKYVDDRDALITRRMTRGATSYTSTASDIDHILIPNVSVLNEGDITISSGTWTVNTAGVYACTLTVSSASGFVEPCSVFISTTRGGCRIPLATGTANFTGGSHVIRLNVGDDVTWGLRFPVGTESVSTQAEVNLLARA